MFKVGSIYGIYTKNVIGKEFAYKYHLCVCSTNRLYLYICSKGFDGDYPVNDTDCPKLDNAVSYVSLSRLIHVPDWRMRRAKPHLVCSLSDVFMREFWMHVARTPVLSERDRTTI